MKIIETIILGIIQGIAEFLPISSSAHLIIFRDVFGVGSFISGNMEMSFDIALHFGTFLAILVYFIKDFWQMFIKGFTKGTKDSKGKMMWMIVVATIPAAIFGVLFEDKIDELVTNSNCYYYDDAKFNGNFQMCIRNDIYEISDQNILPFL